MLAAISIRFYEIAVSVIRGVPYVYVITLQILEIRLQRITLKAKSYNYSIRRSVDYSSDDVLGILVYKSLSHRL